MIVKNEGRNLKRALDSIRPLIDSGAELVVVDSGSTDNTLEIANQYNAKIISLPCEDDEFDFSKYRNISFSACTAPWILAIDADEEFVIMQKRSVSSIINFLKSIPSNVNTAALRVEDIRKGQLISATDGVRFFRKNSTIWKRAIHNRPEFSGNTVAPTGICKIMHYGYDLTDEQAAVKSKRTIGKLLKLIEDDPANLENFFYLSQAYAVFDKNEEQAIKHALYYINRRSETQEFNTSIYYTLLMYYLRSKKLKEFERYFNIATTHIGAPESVDVLWCGVQYGVIKQDNPLTATMAQRFIEAWKSRDEFDKKWPSTFFFTYKQEYLVQAFYYAAMGHFLFGNSHLNSLMSMMDTISVDMKNEISDQIQKSLANMGISHTLFAKKEKSKLIIVGKR